MHVLKAEDFDVVEARETVRTLEQGGVVCFPTDTAYGLGVDPFNDSAVERLFNVKGRSESKPVLLLVDSIEMARSVTEPSPSFETVAAAFWPGPITLVTMANQTIPDRITASTGTVGLRWPRRPLAIELIGLFGRPLTATSANRSNQPGARSVADAMDQLGEGVDLYIDGGRLEGMPVSTVLDLTQSPPVLLREGPVSHKELTGFFEEGIARPSGSDADTTPR